MFFTELLKLLDLTHGNLDHHLKLLEKMQVVERKQVFAITRFKMAVEITDEGRKSFKRHVQGLKDLIESVSNVT